MNYSTLINDPAAGEAIAWAGAHVPHIAGLIAAAIVGIGLAGWMIGRRDAEVDDIPELDLSEYAAPVARGIWKDSGGHYVFSTPRLVELAARHRGDIHSLLAVACQVALSADGVPQLPVRVLRREEQVA